GQGQAHVPAEQPSPVEDPRLPAAHAHARRPRRARLAPPQGPL
ncbi:MAG: LSU ribosomal protein L34p, partial [uncultured Actinomycetospora sp.]